jgi:hypothetical protein
VCLLVTLMEFFARRSFVNTHHSHTDGPCTIL